MADTDKEKKRYMIEFIRSINEIEEAIAPYLEHKKELRKEFKANGWLTSQEMTSALKAYRILKAKGDMDEIYDAYSSIIGDKEESE